nr:unnamed protein product [Spirometra erinaceieuropaei]
MIANSKRERPDHKACSDVATDACLSHSLLCLSPVFSYCQFALDYTSASMDSKELLLSRALYSNRTRCRRTF